MEIIYNAIALKVYSTGATEVRNAGLDLASGVIFDKIYPGGQALSLTFFVPRGITASWSVHVGYRICAYNGMTMVWEGWITGIEPTLSSSGMGVNVTAAGAWSQFLMARKTRKPWADTRLGEDAWAWYTPLAGAEKCTVDRTNRIRFTPKAEAWISGDYAFVYYVAPTGQTVKRITLNYDLQEGAQAWELSVYNLTAAANELSRTTSNATPGVTVAWDSGILGTPTQQIRINFIARANQTPSADGTYYGEVTNIVVYTETGAINAQEISKDIAALATELSTDLSKIGTMPLDIVPFIADPPATYADLLTMAANYGDASYNSWAAYVGLSDLANDGKPPLVLEQRPALTDYDYAIRMDDDNVGGNLSFRQTLDGVRNWIAVQYQDRDGKNVYLTPDDDATLQNIASITQYGVRHAWVTLPTTSATTAATYARRYLALSKDPQWVASGQLVVIGYVRSKGGQRIPAANIAPGKRIRLENWLNDINGTGLTFLITGARYDDSGETCAIDIGQPDTIETFTLRLESIQLNQRSI